MGYRAHSELHCGVVLVSLGNKGPLYPDPTAYEPSCRAMNQSKIKRTSFIVQLHSA